MTQRTKLLSLLTLLTACLLPLTAHAHFLWLVESGEDEARRLHVYFAELAEADDPDLLERIGEVQAWQLDGQGELRAVQFSKGSDSLVANLPDSKHAVYLLNHEYGVISRGGETFLLRYYAKTGPELGLDLWQQIDTKAKQRLDLVPRRQGEEVAVRVLWAGAPLADAQVIVSGPGVELETTSDKDGHATFKIGKPGLYSIRARHIESKAGEREGKKFETTRHYSTLALPISSVSAAADSVEASSYPPIPEKVTSFGAAITEGALYVYGGHTGRAHSYSNTSQANTLRRLKLDKPATWEALGTGPSLQGLALVAHGGKLYRLGGFTAKNKEGEEHDLWSSAEVSTYDPASGEWRNLPPLPEPRSSFDAAVMGDKIYVVGGWKLSGDAETTWHKTAHVLDLSAAEPRWQPLPEPPFQRRALSVAAYQGKLYVIGGMRAEGGPTTRTDVFDPETGRWTQGPDLQGEPMDGFGSSAFATGGRLYVSTYGGSLQRLTSDGSSWEVVEKLDRARFFHRMLPLSDSRLLSVGGASMTEGKFEELDVIDVSPNEAKKAAAEGTSSN